MKRHEQGPDDGVAQHAGSIRKWPLWQEAQESRGVGAFVVNSGESPDESEVGRKL